MWASPAIRQQSWKGDKSRMCLFSLLHMVHIWFIYRGFFCHVDYWELWVAYIISHELPASIRPFQHKSEHAFKQIQTNWSNSTFFPGIRSCQLDPDWAITMFWQNQSLICQHLYPMKNLQLTFANTIMYATSNHTEQFQVSLQLQILVQKCMNDSHTYHKP